MKNFRLVLLMLCALATSAVAAWADIAPAWSDDQLAAFSSAIVEGRVTDVSVGRDIQTNDIYTYVTVAIDDVLKGDVPEREIVVKQLGGAIGNLALAVFDQPTFERGENVLLFLETRPRDRTLYTTALWQGKWTITTDANGGRIALRRSPDGPRSAASERRTLNALTSPLRRSTGVSVRRFVAEPPAEELRMAVSQAVAAGSAPFAYMDTPYRWDQFDSGTPITVDVQAGGQPGLADGGISGLIRAAGVWSSPTGLGFVAGGSTSICEATAGGASNRNKIGIVFMDPCGEVDNDGGVLAVGGAYFFTSGGRTVGGTTFRTVVAGFIVNNDGSTALRFLQNANCFAAVDTHELGHVLGIGHSSDPTAIMFASVSFSACSGGPSPPSADDIAAIKSIYPPAGGSPPGVPTNLTATATGSSVTVSWSAPTTGGAPTSYVLEAGSGTGLSNLANFDTGSTATGFSTSGVPPATYYVRVRAKNSAGTSGTSNEFVLVVR